jgi:tRNA(Ile)-lysidine synthase TilS/MesJ
LPSWIFRYQLHSSSISTKIVDYKYRTHNQNILEKGTCRLCRVPRWGLLENGGGKKILSGKITGLVIQV